MMVGRGRRSRASERMGRGLGWGGGSGQVRPQAEKAGSPSLLHGGAFWPAKGSEGLQRSPSRAESPGRGAVGSSGPSRRGELGQHRAGAECGRRSPTAANSPPCFKGPVPTQRAARPHQAPGGTPALPLPPPHPTLRAKPASKEGGEHHGVSAADQQLPRVPQAGQEGLQGPGRGFGGAGPRWGVRGPWGGRGEDGVDQSLSEQQRMLGISCAARHRKRLREGTRPNRLSQSSWAKSADTGTGLRAPGCSTRGA